MSEGKKLTSVPTATAPDKVFVLEDSAVKQIGMSDFFGKNIESPKFASLSCATGKWLRVASSSVNGGMGLMYLYRDWGSGGPAYTLIGFALPHMNIPLTDTYKPQLVSGFGRTDLLKVRLVKGSDKTTYFDVSVINTVNVYANVKLIYMKGITWQGAAEAPEPASTDTVMEWTVNKL